MSTDNVSIAADKESTSQQDNPEVVITKGKTFLAAQNYYNAVGLLADGCRMMTDKFGETADELAEPYLFYGRALLGLAREEQELAVLGTAVPGTQEEEEEEVDEESASGSATEAKKEEESTSKDASKEQEEPSKEEEKPKEPEMNGTGSGQGQGQYNGYGKCHENGDDEAVEKDAVEKEGDEEEEEEGVPEVEDVDNEDDDGSTNLQIAWEVLELSKMIFQKRSDSTERTQFLSETHRLLGEVALESGNHTGAVGDLSTCLEFMQNLEKVPSRQLAEVHYQLGLAYSLGNEFTKSIEHYEEALKHLDERITYLKSLNESQKDEKHDPKEEIKEIQELIPDIKEKIDDVKDMKQQACKVLLDSIKEHIGEGSCSNGAGPSRASTSSAAGTSASCSSSSVEAKPASDINHLIRKKRKNEDDEITEGSPCKKSNDALPSKSV